MLENLVAPAQKVVLDAYLGFEIRVEEGGRHVANAKFGRETVLEAYSLPSLRKRIWQWWHHVEIFE